MLRIFENPWTDGWITIIIIRRPIHRWSMLGSQNVLRFDGQHAVHLLDGSALQGRTYVSFAEPFRVLSREAFRLKQWWSNQCIADICYTWCSLAVLSIFLCPAYNFSLFFLLLLTLLGWMSNVFSTCCTARHGMAYTHTHHMQRLVSIQCIFLILSLYSCVVQFPKRYWDVFIFHFVTLLRSSLSLIHSPPHKKDTEFVFFSSSRSQ